MKFSISYMCQVWDYVELVERKIKEIRNQKWSRTVQADLIGSIEELEKRTRSVILKTTEPYTHTVDLLQKWREFATELPLDEMVTLRRRHWEQLKTKCELTAQMPPAKLKEVFGMDLTNKTNLKTLHQIVDQAKQQASMEKIKFENVQINK